MPCCGLYQGLWYRAEILDVQEDESEVKKVKVRYIDFGNEDIIDSDQ